MSNEKSIDLYDLIVGRYITPQTLDTIRKEWIEERLREYETGGWPFELDPAQMALQEFRLKVEPIRDGRSNRLGQEIDYLLDGFKEDGSYIDPLLNQAHRIGDGTDLTLRLWSVEEWWAWSYGRLKVAAQVSAAADKDRTRAEEIIDRMKQERVRYTGDLNFT